tara:strand:+ start:37 stop:138 length:102 start_codon:yes stop_codon:yes gene_type:complete
MRDLSWGSDELIGDWNKKGHQWNGSELKGVTGV